MTDTLPKYMWWLKGECVIEVLKRGHYPDTVIVRMPDDEETEVCITDLKGKDTHEPAMGSN